MDYAKEKKMAYAAALLRGHGGSDDDDDLIAEMTEMTMSLLIIVGILFIICCSRNIDTDGKILWYLVMMTMSMVEGYLVDDGYVYDYSMHNDMIFCHYLLTIRIMVSINTVKYYMRR